MTSKPFIGRTKELEKLQMQYSKAMPTLVVVKGRRRIGKSRLVAEFAAKNKNGKLWSFAGLAPDGTMTAQNQRDHFAEQLAAYLKMPPVTFNDWSNAFEYLSMHIKTGDIVLFDEISWMGAHDPTFIPKLKAWWDKQSTHVMLILCSSISTWIEENILNSTAFFGRVNLTLTLMPLSIPESMALLRAIGFQGSDYDSYKLLSIFGGVPWYLEQVIQGMTADELIKHLCFTKDGVLVMEFDRIFHDLFNGTGSVYKKILDALQEGVKTLGEIRYCINFAYSGTLSKLMDNLMAAGFIQKRKLWSFSAAKTKSKKQSLYRICDPYTRFYCKMIAPYRDQIDIDGMDEMPLASISGFDSHMGLQFEYLLLQNRPLLLKAMGISPIDIVCDGPYRQSQTARRQGCQIDYLVQTETKNIFVCEFKFSRRELDSDVATSMQKKIAALQVPKGYAVVPVLFHIGGVSAAVATGNYFYRIIDIAEFLE